jgi:long-chain acyl-CoA synthetase
MNMDVSSSWTERERERKRKKDMIISGRHQVFPKVIEEVIVQHPAAREAAVFSIPSERWDETSLARVILHRPGSLGAEELPDWIDERVDAKNQRVSAVTIMEDFPAQYCGRNAQTHPARALRGGARRKECSSS